MKEENVVTSERWHHAASPNRFEEHKTNTSWASTKNPLFAARRDKQND
jgi:hypothetical protein